MVVDLRCLILGSGAPAIDDMTGFCERSHSLNGLRIQNLVCKKCGDHACRGGVMSSPPFVNVSIIDGRRLVAAPGAPSNDRVLRTIDAAPTRRSRATHGDGVPRHQYHRGSVEATGNNREHAEQCALMLLFFALILTGPFE